MVSQSMHEISAYKPRTVQPFLVAILTFAVLVCRRFDQAPYTQLPGWLNSLCQDFHSTCVVINFSDMQLGLDDAVSEVKT